MTEKKFQPKITKINRCCMVVKDIKHTLRIYEEVFGVGSWRYYEPARLGLIPGETYVRGRQVDFEVRSAVSPVIGADGFTLQLIQPLDHKSHYADYLREHGDSMHHLVVQVDDEAKWADAAIKRGNKVLFEGYYADPPHGQKIFSRQIDLRKELGFICEAVTGSLIPEHTNNQPERLPEIATKQGSPKFLGITQVCSVVEDIDNTVKIYEDLYGIGPWRYTGIDDFRFFKGKTFIKGKQVDFNARIASCHALNIKLELAQPLDDKSHYAEFLHEDDQTLQHMKATPADNNYFGLMKFLRSRYGDPLFEGWIGSKPFIEQYWCNYTDTRADLGFILELVFGPVPVPKKMVENI